MMLSNLFQDVTVNKDASSATTPKPEIEITTENYNITEVDGKNVSIQIDKHYT